MPVRSQDERKERVKVAKDGGLRGTTALLYIFEGEFVEMQGTDEMIEIMDIVMPGIEPCSGYRPASDPKARDHRPESKQAEDNYVSWKEGKTTIDGKPLPPPETK